MMFLRRVLREKPLRSARCLDQPADSVHGKTVQIRRRRATVTRHSNPAHATVPIPWDGKAAPSACRQARRPAESAAEFQRFGQP